jgi:hypothetical protein
MAPVRRRPEPFFTPHGVWVLGIQQTRACDQNRYPFLENSQTQFLLHLAKACCKKRFGGKKQIFGMKSQATIFNPF